MRRSLALALLLSFFSCHLISTPSVASSDEFLQCLRRTIPSELMYTQGSSDFTKVLASSIRNPKFFTNTTVRPLCIVTPAAASHVQAAVVCGRRWAVGLRVRSSGHDYEGLSYRSVRPMDFAVVDLAALRAVFVNHSDSTAWVDSGATIGELYYSIAKSSPETAFPAGVCLTMGVGGHFSGGGMGLMMRKHGLSADNVVDAKLVNRDGAVVGRAAMGEGLFWAVRGGGGASFGVLLSWKVRLVRVPPKVAVFNVARTVDQGAIGILARWQDVAPALPDELTIRVLVQGRQRALFQALYLGTCESLVATMGREFPELGMTGPDCRPITWLQSVGFASFGNADTPVEQLLNRTTGALSSSSFVKNKSDYVRRAIPKAVWENIFSRWFSKNIGSGGGGGGDGLMILGPHGGFMSTVPAAATPYPHRDGVLYNIQYIVSWQQQHGDDGAAAMTWLGSLYGFMGQHVSKDPREAYVNYRDLDIGENSVVGNGVDGFDAGKAWGERYFMGNYRRLAQVKAAVDPTDYFRNEQSIPPLFQVPTTQLMI